MSSEGDFDRILGRSIFLGVLITFIGGGGYALYDCGWKWGYHQCAEDHKERDASKEREETRVKIDRLENRIEELESKQ